MKNSNEKPKETALPTLDVAEQQFKTAAESEDIDFYDLQLIKEKLLQLKEEEQKE